MRYAIAVLLLVVGCRNLPKEPPEPPARIPIHETPAELEAAKRAAAAEEQRRKMQHPPVVKLSDVVRDYKDNELLGDQKYKGKRYRFVGRVANVGVTLGDPVVSLGDVKCFFGKEGSKNPNLTKLRRGDDVVFDGTCKGAGVIGGVVFHDCIWPYDDDVKMQTPELWK